MAYERQYYTNGDVLDARQMNHMETGIKENSDNISKLSEEKANRIVETASGEVIVVTDSAEAKPLGLAIDGKSEQNQYSGNQLANLKNDYSKTINGITVAVKDGKITVSGTPTTVNDNYSSFNVGTVVDGNANETYTASLNKKIVGIGFAFSEETKFNFTMADTRTSITDVYAGSTNVNYAVVNIKNNIGTINETFELMFNEGDTAKPFEPYCGGIPSPNPSYPQEIRNIGVYDEASGKYAVEVKCTGKNEYNPDLGSLSVMKDCTVTQEKGLYTITAKNNGLIYFNEIQAVNQAWTTNRSPLVPVIGDTTYALKLSNNMHLLALMEYDDSKICINNHTVDVSGYVFKTKIETKYILAKIGLTNAVSGTVYTTKIQLERGSTATPYEPFEETTATVYLDEPLRKGDKAYWNGGKLLVERKRKRIKVLPTMGFLVWPTQNAKYNRYMLAVDDVADESGIAYPVMSDYFASTTKGNAFSEKVSCGVFVDTTSSSSGIRRIGFVDSTHSTIDDFKQFLTDNDVFVEYELATPITEEIDIDLDGLSMFYPTTILSNDCNANMEVEYIADTKAYIDKKFAELATAMV